MAASATDALFVTANVGSIFEDPTSMLRVWCDEFLSTVSRLAPKFVALHCQEVGGKNYERSMQHVADFVKLLMASEELQHFNKIRIFLDEDYSSAEHFTALGNFYFIHESVSDENIEIFNFQEGRFQPVCGKEVYSENIEDVATKEKSKFPQEFFPECKWSRKGFMRTRWNLNGTVFDLINIHLFHDASNFVAIESFPSVYCKNRQRALEHTLKRFHTDQYGVVPFFVFGDFNFRTDAQGVVKKLSEGLNAEKIPSSKSTDHTKVQYRDESSQEVVFTLGKKEFSHQDHQKLFVGDDSEWLREFDRELESFTGQLFEFSINFPPTYPYVEDSERGELYMQTRCPSWCDRVFFSSSARFLINNSDDNKITEYGLIGQNACMGDHKPVFLRAALQSGLGTVSCCEMPAAPCTSCLSSASPLEHMCRLCSEQSVEPSTFPMFAEPEQDHSVLVVPKFHRHTSPYTPDSTDTEPDMGEEIPPNEEPLYLKTKSDRRVNRFDASSRKRLHLTNESCMYSDDDSSLLRDSSSRRSGSKIPVRVAEVKENVVLSVSPVSKIPVSKHMVSKHDRDVMLKHRNGKQMSLSPPILDKRFTSKNVSSVIPCEPYTSSTPVGTVLKDVNLVLQPQSFDGRKHMCRQKNIDQHSSDSDAGSLELGDDQSSMFDQRNNVIMSDESKVEIQLSLVETPPSFISPVDSESVGLLTTQAHGFGGSTTDSGVSVSPDLSVATSPSTDDNDKAVIEPSANIESTEEEDSKAETSPSSLERFTFVRRIQSASAMERKSSFPLPSSIFFDNQPSLTSFGGSGSNLWGMRTCRCMSDSSWRQRSSTNSHSILSSKSGSRIRLISTSSHLDRSLPRLQSHHSSSEEDWFEEVVNELQENSKSGDEDITRIEDAKGNVNMKDCGQRLPTHEEYVSENVSNNCSSWNFDADIEKSGAEVSIKPDAFIPTQMQSQSLSDSLRQVDAVDQSMSPTCLGDSERITGFEGGTFQSLILKVKEKYPAEDSENLNQAEEIHLCHSTPVPTLQGESMIKPEEAPLQPRRPSVTSNISKTQNSHTCKACCTLL